MTTELIHFVDNVLVEELNQTPVPSPEEVYEIYEDHQGEVSWDEINALFI